MAKKQDKGDEPPDFLGDGLGDDGSNPNLPDFGVGGNIFTTPTSLLGQPTTIGADISSGAGLTLGSLLNKPADIALTILSGATPAINVPATSISFAPSGTLAPDTTSLGLSVSPLTKQTDISQLAPNWGTWNPRTDVSTAAPADLSGVTLQQQPVSNIFSTTSGTPATSVSTTTASDVTTLPAVTVSTTPVTPQTMTGQIVQPKVEVTGASLGGAVSTEAPGVTVMDPFQVVDTKLPKATLNLSQPTQTTTTTGDAGAGTSSDVTTLPAVTVTGTKPTTAPTMSSTDMQNLLNEATKNWGTTPVQLPPVTATASTTATTTVTPVTPNVSTPTVNPPPLSVFVPPAVTVPPSTTTPPPSTVTPTTTPTTPTITQTGTATPTTTTTSSAMTERDLKAELEKTMAAFDQYRPRIQQMYGDLYQQFMPKGITAAEPGIINQYQSDLARLQQRQAGILSPEDVRQSQQAAREAYGARGQVMGPGAVGAEILNREAIRQQREDQARQAMQQSYGNVLNMANLQTGNIFSPIASLMSQTFNPMGAYPADVYGTNVNAALAREITQRNNEAAIKAAELTGSAAKSAANTGLFGDFLKVGAGVKIYFACMPGDQAIDTPNGPVAVKDIKGGDEVVGYDGSPVKVVQVSSYVQDADRDFFTFHLSNGGKITVCDRHKILDIPASEWVVGAKMGDAVIQRIDRKNGVTTSYDLVTEVGGYQIAGVPVNSMVPEMLAATLQLVALKHYA